MTLGPNSVAVITGAGSGIGRALAFRLASEALSGIALADIDEVGLKETVESIPHSPTKVISHVLDVSKKTEMATYAKKVEESFGCVTHLINNAGVGLFGNFEEISLDDFEWLMSINFWGVVYGTKYFLPMLRREEVSHIVNVSSVFGMIAPPEQTAYCASKFAVRGFTESLRHELEGTNVRVSTVHPGGIKTNIARNSRLGEKTPEENKTQGTKFFDKVAVTSAEKAAETIVRGIKNEDPRILIGNDARAIDYIQRIFPKRYLKVFEMIVGHRLDLRKKSE